MPRVLHNPDLAVALGLAPVPGGAWHEPCLRCGSRNIWPEVSFEGPFGIYCAKCNWGGPRASEPDGDPDAAWAAWDREARQVRLARTLGLTINLDQPPPEAEDVC